MSSSAVAPNRGVSATILLMLVVTGGCLAMASAVPVANGRRLQQFASTSGSQLPSQLRALTSGIENLRGELQVLLGTVPPQDDLRGQLQQVATSFAQGQSHLQSAVQALQDLQVLGQPEAETVLGNLLNQIAVKLEAVSKQSQNPQTDGGCFRVLQIDVLTAISDLTSQLKSTTAGLLLPLELQPIVLLSADLTRDLEKLRNAVGLVDPCAPGLQALQSNDQGVLAAVNQLIAGIRQ